jgi:uncharacterized protein with HEPN domain
MERELAPILQDILQSIERIEIVTSGMTLETFSTDWRTSYIVPRAIEIISEASRRIPAPLKAKRPEIPWRQVMGIGNVLRHQYQGLSDAIIWGVVVDELPKLRRAIESLSRDEV